MNSESTKALTKRRAPIYQQSRERTGCGANTGLTSTPKNFSRTPLAFAYVDLDQNVSWKSFVNDVGENSVCVASFQLKYEKLGNSCAEDEVRIKLDAVGRKRELEKEVKDNRGFILLILANGKKK